MNRSLKLALVACSLLALALPVARVLGDPEQLARLSVWLRRGKHLEDLSRGEPVARSHARAVVRTAQAEADPEVAVAIRRADRRDRLERAQMLGLTCQLGASR